MGYDFLDGAKDLHSEDIETFASGGGFYHAQADLGNGYAAVVSNDPVDELTIYDNTDGDWYEENMVFSENTKHLPKSLYKLYKVILDKLKSDFPNAPYANW